MATDHCERWSEKITRDPPQRRPRPCVFPPRRSTSLSGEWEGRNEGGERERGGMGEEGANGTDIIILLIYDHSDVVTYNAIV